LIDTTKIYDFYGNFDFHGLFDKLRRSKGKRKIKKRAYPGIRHELKRIRITTIVHSRCGGADNNVQFIMGSLSPQKINYFWVVSEVWFEAVVLRTDCRTMVVGLGPPHTPTQPPMQAPAQALM
jgi:hypothetical protein